ncbi:hypothetical protein QO010_003352 [Caulobacter ginsengisoli]|uniref:Uncharacterized protein n=1 Tax=Caulobacter ginsengisoli TaxID=400775 RepID=A0ABU0IU73_9CAUL|nr:hypothetical protein [Caulobacter ginsengisoli]MDQ0465563.1 hypothetical protein [Caulobacter ginsengisoli]
MGKFDDLAAARAAIITKRELEQLKTNRAAPGAHQHLRPDGVEASSIQSGAVEADERRIAHIETRFGVLKEQASAEHRLSALKGHAKRGFGHDR